MFRENLRRVRFKRNSGMKLKTLWVLLKETVDEFVQDCVLRLAAATAYYAMFSIGPLLVLVVGLASLVFGEHTVRHEVMTQAESFVGRDAAKMISSMMNAQRPGETWVAAILGGVALVLGATGVFSQLQDSLNTVWGVTAKPGKSLWAFVRDRVFSMAMVLGIGFLLLVSMALTAFVNSFTAYVGGLIALAAWVAIFFNSAVSFLVIALLFALIFKVLPDVKIRWSDVWFGALGTAALFTIGKFLLGLYLAHETSVSAYGAGSAFIVIMLYVYYSSVILYFGAEFTQVHARHRGGRIEPSKYAVRMTGQQFIEQGMPRREQIEEADRRSRPPDQQDGSSHAE